MNVARERGLRLTGHIPREVGIDGVLSEGGQGSIAHIEELFNKVFAGTPDDGRVPSLVEQVARGRLTVVTTLATYEAIARARAPGLGGLLERPERGLVEPVRRMLWDRPYNRYAAAGEAGEFYRGALAFQQRIAKALQQAGVLLVAGTDAGELPGLVLGPDLHRELELLVEAGLTPWEAIATATRNAGSFLADGAFGTAAAGQRADLLLLDADPLRDIRSTRRIEGVVVRGRYRSRLELDTLLAGVQERYAATARVLEAVREGGVSEARRVLAQGARPAEASLGFLAFTLAMQGQVEPAVQLLGVAVELYPDSYLAAYMLGHFLRVAGQEERARSEFARVLRLSPGHDGARAAVESPPG